MSLGPTPLEEINRARADLRMGGFLSIWAGCSRWRWRHFRLRDWPTCARSGPPHPDPHRTARGDVEAIAYDGDIARVMVPEGGADLAAARAGRSGG